MMEIPSAAESMARACRRTVSAVFASRYALMPTRTAKQRMETPKSENRRMRHSEGNCATCTKTISGAKTKNALVRMTPLKVFLPRGRAVCSAADGCQRAAQNAPQRKGSVQHRSASVPVGVALREGRYLDKPELAVKMEK